MRMKRFKHFEDLIELHNSDLEKLMKEITTDNLLYALKGCSDDLSFKIFSIMSESAASYVESELDELGPVPLEDVEEAQNKILSFANNLLNTDRPKIALASDHAAFELKEFIKENLPEYDVVDFGTENEESMDYPDTGFKAAEAVANGTCEKGIIMCGSGIGMSIVANKVKGIRAALCHCTDFAKVTRQHNDANVVVLPGRFISKHLAKEIVQLFLTTEFEGGRHQRRIDKIHKYERGE
jgi:ribose 5-phosphate isomerase B